MCVLFGVCFCECVWIPRQKKKQQHNFIAKADSQIPSIYFFSISISTLVLLRPVFSAGENVTKNQFCNLTHMKEF